MSEEESAVKLALPLLVVALGVVPAAGALAQHAHEHGVAELRIALDGPTVLVEFESPLVNLLGFEHAPRSDAEKAAMAALEDTLRAPERLFALPAAAGCSLEEVELELPGAAQHAGHDHEHDSHGHGHEDEHADAYAVWEYVCTTPPGAVEVTVIEAFPAIRVLRSEVAGPRGQTAGRIETPRGHLAL